MPLLRVFVVTALVVLVASACGGSDEAAQPTVEVDQEIEGAPSGRKPAPPVAGRTLDGNSISLDDFRGRPVLVNVWSSW